MYFILASVDDDGDGDDDDDDDDNVERKKFSRVTLSGIPIPIPYPTSLSDIHKVVPNHPPRICVKAISITRRAVGHCLG